MKETCGSPDYCRQGAKCVNTGSGSQCSKFFSHILTCSKLAEGESRHPCRTPTVARNQFPMLLLKRTALVALPWTFILTRIRLAQKLYFFMVAHKATAADVDLWATM